MPDIDRRSFHAERRRAREAQRLKENLQSKIAYLQEENLKLRDKVQPMKDIRAFNISYYRFWREKRLKEWIYHYGVDWFSGKKILELGAGTGDIGNVLCELGADVTCFEAQKSFVEAARLRFPRLKVVQGDVESFELPDKKYDLVIHTGLLYHIHPDNLKQHLRQVFDIGTEAIIESVVVDSSDPEYCVPIDEYSSKNKRLAYNEIGARFSPAYIEKLFKELGVGWYRGYEKCGLGCSRSPEEWKYGEGHWSWTVKGTNRWGTPQFKRLWYVRAK